jgi:DNA (cytosine-5)-methyltransferase 1
MLAPGHPKHQPSRDGFGLNGGRIIGGHQTNNGRAGKAMGIDWMAPREVTQAVPPAYTEYIGHRLLQVVAVAA